MAQSNTTPRLRVDTHVHMHSCFDQDSFLDAAANSVCETPTQGRHVSGVLCLTETYEANWFQSVVSKLSSPDGEANRWRFEATSEANTVLATRANAQQLAIVAGRQIVTSEGLEVLALGLADHLADGQATHRVLEAVARAGAVPVLPWGFGKWTARRGRLVGELIKNPPCPFFLGDNGGRLSMSSEPREFADGRERGMEILPGTDPFPFAWDEHRVGSFGAEWDASLDPGRPFHGLQALLIDRSRPMRRYGRLERLPRFIRNQLAIQVRKRTRLFAQ